MTPHRGPHGVDLSKRRGVKPTRSVGACDDKADELIAGLFLRDPGRAASIQIRRIQAREAGK